MSYTALYRKFRPDNFADVKGQDHIVTTLTNQIKHNRIGHAYLFCGTRGTGKTTVAKILAKAVNCEHPVNGSPCNECAMCKAIQAGTAMNVIEIDAASNNGVDNIREIREEVSYRPTEGKYKVYIIDEVHMLSTGAFNALLKTLEEPPSYVMFILATTEAHKIPITILSRCQRYDFHRITIVCFSSRENVSNDIILHFLRLMNPDGIRKGKIMKAAVKVKNLTKSFGKEKVLKGISHTFEAGKIHGIIGFNGSGKTVMFMHTQEAQFHEKVAGALQNRRVVVAVHPHHWTSKDLSFY